MDSSVVTPWLNLMPVIVPLLSQRLSCLPILFFSYFSFPILFTFSSFQSDDLEILLIAFSILLYLLLSPKQTDSKSWGSSRVVTQKLFIKVNRRN